MALIEKARRKARRIVVSGFRGAKLYPYLYPAYWYSKIAKPGGNLETLYFTARPNPGAGIGHQMANWIAGYWFAGQFGLRFAHSPFPSPQWENFLGFGRGETTVRELTKSGYMVRRLPLFSENDDADLRRIQSIINAYAGKRVVFLAEQDQFYHDQYGVMNELQEKFYAAPARQDDKTVYSSGKTNLAVHIRRGDIVRQKHGENANLTMRYLNNQYFTEAINTALGVLAGGKEVEIYIFSQGKEEEFIEFRRFNNLHLCLDMGAMDSFLHMVYADGLITSKSSFSYKPALLNKGIKFCPNDFWHGYPDDPQWILLDEHGRRIDRQRVAEQRV